MVVVVAAAAVTGWRGAGPQFMVTQSLLCRESSSPAQAPHFLWGWVLFTWTGIAGTPVPQHPPLSPWPTDSWSPVSTRGTRAGAGRDSSRSPGQPPVGQAWDLACLAKDMIGGQARAGSHMSPTRGPASSFLGQLIWLHLNLLSGTLPIHLAHTA